MLNIKAMDLLMYTEEEVLALPPGHVSVKFKDGVLRTTRNRTVLTWYLWGVVRKFQGLVLFKRHFLKPGRCCAGFELDNGNEVFYDAYEAYIALGDYDDDKIFWEMSEAQCQNITAIYEFVTNELGDYVSPLDYTDVDTIRRDKFILECKAKYKAGDANIETTHENIIKYITSDVKSMRLNEIARQARAGILSINQLKQLIGPRGMVTAPDTRIFKTPIHKGYFDNLNTSYDILTELRGASIALYANDAPLQSSEYTARLVQLLVSVLTGIDGDDCETPHFVPWLVNKTDMPSLNGKFHMVNGKAVPITLEDTNLIGKEIKLRSITMCINDNPARPCKTCVGALSRIVPSKSNIGHMFVAIVLAIISQSLLSAKHLVSSIETLLLGIDSQASRWIDQDKNNKTHIRLVRKTTVNSFILRVIKDEVPGLASLLNSTTSSSANPVRISALTRVEIIPLDKQGKMTDDVGYISTEVQKGKSCLSPYVLKAIHEGNYVVDGEHIDITITDAYRKIIFITPRCNENLIAYLRTFLYFIEGSAKTKKEDRNKTRNRIIDYTTPGEAIRGLMDILDVKMKVNVLQAEIIIRALMTTDPDNMDFNLPKGGEEFKFSKFNEIVSNRSITSLFAYQGQRKSLLTPGVYLKGIERPDIPLDALFGDS